MSPATPPPMMIASVRFIVFSRAGLWVEEGGKPERAGILALMNGETFPASLSYALPRRNTRRPKP
jgi:hypothetical protein